MLYGNCNKLKIRQKKILLFLLFLLLAVYTVPAEEQGIFRVNKHNIKKTSDVKVSWLMPAYVFKVVDGDTIVVSIDNPPEGIKQKEKVRFLGVDTPESVHPKKPVEHFGKEAALMTKAILFEKQVYLAFDWNIRDKYGRLLAYIYLSDGVCFNALQLKYGYAHVYTKFPFQFLEEFRQNAAEARIKKLGLWK